MAVLYIKEQGAMIQKNGERIIVTKNHKQLLDVPVLHIENIAVIGNVQISTQALHLLMEKGVDVSYLSYSGQYLGHTAAEASKNIFLRFEQYRFYMDERRRLEMAKCIVRNKIENQMAVIRQHRWNEEYDWKADIRSMETLLTSIPKKETANELLGVEGKILSIAYTLLTKEICNSLDAESFEPYLGFLHGIRYGRKSLALDLVEEFRQPIVDRLVILLFNKRMIGKYDFTFEEEGRVLLNEDGFCKFCSEYERWMNGKNTASGESSFRTKIREQIALLKRVISKGETYKPYSWR